ncbi:MAG: M20/M25/M40 family metallo-hydrolase, partial [Azoarcus sp.]|nr:M20/M25/M40 family metallo-hydrolase [Azoarcus sp.]
HKGKAAYRAICRGEEGHSALAPKFANAIHAASDLIQAIRTTQAALADGGIRDEDYDVPYSTLHVGKIAGGKALNIVPNECTLDFEIRSVVGDDADAILGSVRRHMAQCATSASRTPAPAIEQVNAYPGLDTHPTSEAVRFIERVLPANTGKTKVAFGTEGGLFQQHLKTPVIICGPGSIDVAHKRDEYVDVDQMHACDTFLGSIVASICR